MAYGQHVTREACEQILEEKLPPGNPPAEGNEPAFTKWREELQRALVETFCELCEDFACKGQLAGTTVTVVLQVNFIPSLPFLSSSLLANASHSVY